MFTVRRIRAEDGPLLRSIRLAALADAPGDNNTTLARAQAHDEDHWNQAAEVNSLGGLQATFFAEAVEPGAGEADSALAAPAESGAGDATEGGEVRQVGMIGAYANRDGVVNLMGLWSAPGYRDIGVANALIDAVGDWALASGADRLRLWVVERNEYARRFYESQGFEPTGSTMPYEPDPRINQIQMIKPLRLH